MNNKTPILIFGLFVITVITAWSLWPVSKSPETVAEKPKPTQQAIDPTLKPYLPEIEEIKKLAKTEPQKAKSKTEALLDKLPERYRRSYTLGFEAGMEDIDFYGQIVDQYGEPVTNASVGFSTGGAMLAPGKGIGKVSADEQGRFEIHSEGGSLSLFNIKAPGINFSFPVPTHIKNSRFGAHIKEMRFTGYQHNVGGNDPLWTGTSPEKPYVFTAWRVDKYEKILVGDLNSYQFPDGRVYTFKLDKKKYEERREEGSTDGHLFVSCTREPIERVQDHVDWQVTITPVDGGIQTTDDLYLNLAPETGYQPSLTIDMRKGSPDYKESLINQRYFFTAKSGQVYGSLYMHIEPNAKQGKKCRIDITQYKVNLDGSRNLAVKPRH